MRPAYLLLTMILALLSAAPDGRAQDIARDLQRSHQIQQRATGRLTGAPGTSSGIPAAPALAVPEVQPVPQNTPATQTPALIPAAVTTGVPASSPLSSGEKIEQAALPAMWSFEKPAATSNIDLHADPFKPKLKVPSYEAQYRAALLRQKQEQAKKKSLMGAILDEITNYGLFFLLGIVIFLVIYALRKDPSKAGPSKLTTTPSETEEKKDIWKSDDLIT